MANPWQLFCVEQNQGDQTDKNPNFPVTNYEKANEAARKPDGGGAIDTEQKKAYAKKLKIDPVNSKEEQEEDRTYGYNP
jgi:hypothetical protein